MDECMLFKYTFKINCSLTFVICYEFWPKRSKCKSVSLGCLEFK